MRTHRVAMCAIGALAGIVSAAGTADARPIVMWTASLDGAQEVPPVATPATGLVTGTINDATGLVTITSGTFSGLIGTSNNCHIHGPAPIGTPTGITLGLTFDFGVTSGTISGSGILTRGGFTTQQLIDSFFSGLHYVNLHSTFRPGGEIRGQIQIVPAPGAAGLAAVAGLALLRRRR